MLVVGKVWLCVAAWCLAMGMGSNTTALKFVIVVQSKDLVLDKRDCTNNELS